MINNNLATYSPESVKVILSNGKFTHSLSGYVDGTFIDIERTVPHATLYTGADATNARVVRAVRNFDITVTLHQASESNDVLSQLLLLDEQTRNDENLFEITIKDLSGRTMAYSPQSFIGTSPNQSFATDLSENAWVLHAINMVIHQGGNARITESTRSTLTDFLMSMNVPSTNPVILMAPQMIMLTSSGE